ncbi:MAG: hypothetical protein V4793_22275 [Paraburkholderia tropica]|uniref:hypothetical protein n=1 Tax=Burkholderia gladioli TaxID=28095 RepID=UPI000628C60A|nr:hypothetical protein [Burkholderia gladioli]KKJ08066.1 hypothetical protein XF14_00510 [Burkholderia gladioli]MDN7600943.1 hypothetical protein [Burkholderia gladioli]
MTESIDKPDLQAATSPGASVAGLPFLAVLATTLAMALAAIGGGALAYCDSGGGALLWVIYLALLMPVGAMLNAPVECALAVVIYVAIVFAISRWSRLKLTLGMALTAIVCSAVLSAAVTWFLSDVRHACRIG